VAFGDSSRQGGGDEHNAGCCQFRISVQADAPVSARRTNSYGADQPAAKVSKFPYLSAVRHPRLPHAITGGPRPGRDAQGPVRTARAAAPTARRPANGKTPRSGQSCLHMDRDRPGPRLTDAQINKGVPWRETVTASIRNTSEQPIYSAELVSDNGSAPLAEVAAQPTSTSACRSGQSYMGIDAMRPIAGIPLLLRTRSR
jgi:hypothetical protein